MTRNRIHQSRGTGSSYHCNRTRPTIQPLERRVLLSSAVNPLQLPGFTWLGHQYAFASQTSPVTVPVTDPTPTPVVGATNPVTSTAPAQDSVNGLQGQYYPNTTLAGSPAVTEVDPTIAYNWALVPPPTGVVASSFSARWTGQIKAPATGKFTFYASWIGGVRVILGNTILINHPKISRYAASSYKSVTLVAGQTYSIEVDYFCAPAKSRMLLQWAGPGFKKQTISNSVLFSGVSAPVTPANLTAQTGSATTINLSWQPDAADTSYDLQRSDDGVTYTVIATLDGGVTAYTDSALPSATSFSYRIVGSNAAGDSAPSDPVAANTAALGPSNPTSFTAHVNGSLHIDLAWADNVGDQQGFIIQRSKDGGAWEAVATVGAGVTSYTDTTAPTGHDYTYQIVAYNSAGNSTAVTADVALPPAPPSNLNISVNSPSSLTLSWTNPSVDATGYIIYRSVNNAGYVQVQTMGAPSASGNVPLIAYNDTTVAAGNSYQYAVYATANGMTSDAATAFEAMALPAPSNLQDTVFSSGVGLSWTSNSTGQTSFQIQRSPAGAGNFSTIASVGGTTTTYTDNSVVPSGSYDYRIVAATDFALSPPSNTVSASIPNTSNAPQYLLTPGVLSNMQAQAQANSGQWPAFKARLDAALPTVITPAYQADELQWIGDYAFGYQVLKNSDPTRAAAYADKAIAIIKSGLHDSQRDYTSTRMLLARGDGSTTQFALPNGGIIPSSFRVWLRGIGTESVVHTTPTGQDPAFDAFDFVGVSDNPTGPATYTRGVDYNLVSVSYAQNAIQWLPGGRQPAQGASYYVQLSSAAQGGPMTSGYTLNGSTLTINVPPTVDQVLFVEYAYNDPVSGLQYQQTGNGNGGFNSVQIDTGYTSRYLKYIAIGLDWLWDFSGFTSSLRSETISMLVRWSDYVRDHGYYATSPASNYGAGNYAMRLAIAIALNGRDVTDGPRLISEMEAYHTNYVLPLFQPPANGQATEQGGFWGEGWNYGALAVRNVLTSELAFETAGLGSASAAKAWSNEVITALLEEQPTQATVYDAGDGYASPEPVPGKTLFSDLAGMATDPTLKSYAMWIVANYSGAQDWSYPSWEDVMNSSAAAPSNWGSNLPLQYLSAGSGQAVARKDWNYNSTWLAFHSGNTVWADHQPRDQGQLEINRGADELLVNATTVGGDQVFQDKSTYSNAVLIDDGGAGYQTYRYAQGLNFGNPGVTMPHFDGTASYTYMQGNYAAAYNKTDGSTGSATELVRDVFYVRGSDYIITYDRATTAQPQFLKQLQWNFSAAPTVSGNSWVETVGGSKLFGQTFSDVALTTALRTETVGSAAIKQVITNNASATSTVDYVTAMQVAGSGVANMDTSTHVESADAKLEGVQIGNCIVLFGKHGAVSGGTSYSFTAGSGQSTTHYLTDMTPGVTYTLSGADQGSATANAQGVVTFTTTGTGSAQTVTLS